MKLRAARKPNSAARSIHTHVLNEEWADLMLSCSQAPLPAPLTLMPSSLTACVEWLPLYTTSRGDMGLPSLYICQDAASATSAEGANWTHMACSTHHSRLQIPSVMLQRHWHVHASSSITTSLIYCAHFCIILIGFSRLNPCQVSVLLLVAVSSPLLVPHTRSCSNRPARQIQQVHCFTLYQAIALCSNPWQLIH